VAITAHLNRDLTQQQLLPLRRELINPRTLMAQRRVLSKAGRFRYEECDPLKQ
jgi:hypothetical protein